MASLITGGMRPLFATLRGLTSVIRPALFCALSAVLFLGAPAHGQQSLIDQQIAAALFAKCTGPGPFTSDLIQKCTAAFGGGLASVGGPEAGSLGGSLSNSGTLGSVSLGGSAVEGRCVGSAAKCAEEQKKKKGAGASADFSLGNFGFLFAVQNGKVDRDATLLESGYNADVRGYAGGVDYKFTDNFVAGVTFSETENRAIIFGGIDAANSTNRTFTLYGTYTPVANAYLSAYLGAGRIHQDSSRRVSFFGTPGTIVSQNSGHLDAAGVAGGYDWNIGPATLGAFLNVDSLNMRFDGYTETGNTGLEQLYPSQKIDSLTSTLGLRLSARKGFEWGGLTPELRFAAVHQYRNDARTIVSSLVINPAAPITVTTDAPDRNYYLAGAGLVMELGRAVRLFVDYEKRTGHAYLSSWVATGGIHVGF